jgi:hypothetical protein
VRGGVQERKPNAETQRARRIRREEGAMIKRKSRRVAGKLTGKKKRMTVKEMLALGRRFRKSIKGPLIDHAEFLYDENGLPK